MSLIVVLGMALALAMDAFAVSIGLSVSLRGLRNLQTFRLALSFGLFQFFMPIIGWAAGEKIVRFIKDYDHWVAFILLLAVGGKMIYESFHAEDEQKKYASDPTKGLSLLVLSVATSIDSLAVGLSLAALRVKIVYPAVIIGIVAFTMTIVGVKIGPVLGRVIGKRAEFAGGAVLILIGVKILAEHLT